MSLFDDQNAFNLSVHELHGPKPPEKSAEENECLNRAFKLSKEYDNSKQVPVDDLYRDGRSLRAGDILSRKLNGSTFSSGQYNSGSYSGPTGSSTGGIFIHYAIYYRSIGDDKHEIIEKCGNTNDRGTHIWKTVVSLAHLKKYFKIVIDCRYGATCDMALKIYNEKLDAGYCFTFSNCEHFAKFCLTRHGNFAGWSGQVLPANVGFGFVALFRSFFGGLAKVITHPFYMIGGDMDLDSRFMKNNLPFGVDSDEIVYGIRNGTKIFIGDCSLMEIPVPWFPHD